MSIHIQKIYEDKKNCALTHEDIVKNEMKNLKQCLHKMETSHKNGKKYTLCENMGFASRYFLYLQGYKFEEKNNGINVHL